MFKLSPMCMSLIDRWNRPVHGVHVRAHIQDTRAADSDATTACYWQAHHFLTSQQQWHRSGTIQPGWASHQEWTTRTLAAQRHTIPSDGPLSGVAESGGSPYCSTTTAQIVQQFERYGYYFLGPTLNHAEVEVLQSAAKRRSPILATILLATRLKVRPSAECSFDTAARDLIVREPFASLEGLSQLSLHQSW